MIMNEEIKSGWHSFLLTAADRSCSPRTRIIQSEVRIQRESERRPPRPTRHEGAIPQPNRPDCTRILSCLPRVNKRPPRRCPTAVDSNPESHLESLTFSLQQSKFGWQRGVSSARHLLERTERHCDAMHAVCESAYVNALVALDTVFVFFFNDHPSFFILSFPLFSRLKKGVILALYDQMTCKRTHRM